MAKEMKPVKTVLQRAIESGERGIQRMESNARNIRDTADAEIEAIREKAHEQITKTAKRIAQKRVLLDAMKKGSIAP